MPRKLRNLQFLLIVLSALFVAADLFLIFVPGWVDPWSVTAAVMCLLLILVTLLRLFPRFRPPVRFTSFVLKILASLLVPISLLFLLMMNHFNPFGGDTLVAEHYDPESGSTLYVYEQSVFPDPGADLQLRYRSGWLPVVQVLGTYESCGNVISTLESGIVRLECGYQGLELKVHMSTGEVEENTGMNVRHRSSKSPGISSGNTEGIPTSCTGFRYL